MRSGVGRGGVAWACWLGMKSNPPLEREKKGGKEKEWMDGWMNRRFLLQKRRTIDMFLCDVNIHTFPFFSIHVVRGRKGAHCMHELSTLAHGNILLWVQFLLYMICY
jgi:hypothetical protein